VQALSTVTSFVELVGFALLFRSRFVLILNDQFFINCLRIMTVCITC
jgi:hypothetical protein